MTLTLAEQIEAARAFVAARLGERRPEIGLILGSGLGAASLPLASPIAIESAAIPHLPTPSVEGHGGQWSVGALEGVEVVVAGGRVHAYEGVPLPRLGYGARLMAALGCRSLIVTNAAGGIRDDLAPGSLVRIRDHINLLGGSPLVGAHDASLGARFVDMTEVYDPEWGRRATEIAAGLGIALAEGVYAACLGPQYETPAEIGFLEAIGADAVGMSTVPEVIVARQVGLRVLGLSLITNRAAGRAGHALSHDEVLEEGRRAAGDLTRLITALVADRPQRD